MPIAAIGALFETRIAWEWLAHAAMSVALWAQVRAGSPADDPIADLTERLRHPVRWTIRHPISRVKQVLTRR